MKDAVIKLTLSKTAAGWYVEHEANGERHSYSVACEAGEWDALNPALAGTFETPFKTPEKKEPQKEKKK
ncbi:MAG: hypothetical protein ACTTI3_06915 [Treponema sp.]